MGELSTGEWVGKDADREGWLRRAGNSLLYHVIPSKSNFLHNKGKRVKSIRGLKRAFAKLPLKDVDCPLRGTLCRTRHLFTDTGSGMALTSEEGKNKTYLDTSHY